MYDDNGINDTQQQEFLSSQTISDKEELSKKRTKEFEKLYIKASLPSGFFFDGDDWLTYQNEMDTQTVPIKICSRLEVIARSRDQNGENHGRLLQFSDTDGLVHKWAMPMELLAGDGNLYRQELLSKGLMIAPGTKARQSLTNYIQMSVPNNTVRCVQHTGWNKDRTAFVFRHETIGNPGDEPLILQTTSDLPATQAISGTLAEWRQTAALCERNSRLIFAVSAAFASPLLFPLGMENFGVHFRGGSSCGKTTCLKVAASVWGGSDFLQQWRATANGLEGSAASHNDCLLCLDEMGQIDPGEIGKVAYMLANGTGKTRSDKMGQSRKQTRWRLIFLSSGEISLADHMLEAKMRTRAGQEVRVLDIPADGRTYGCFENLHGIERGKAFAEHLVDLCKSNYGTPGMEFVNRLLTCQDRVIQDSRALMMALSHKYIPATASGQVSRVFNHFALIAVAGELASTFGITGWKEGAAIEAAMCCFHDWLRVRGDMGPQEEKTILSQVRHFFEQHGESRFALWNVADQEKHGKTHMRAGFRRPGDAGEEFFVFPESFKRDICTGFDMAQVAQVCLKHKLLMPDKKGGATRSERLPGAQNSKRVYRFTSKVMADVEEMEL